MDNIKKRLSESLSDAPIEELQDMLDDVCILVELFVERQVILQEIILDRLENSFQKAGTIGDL